jgi:hypothetical protein
MAVAALACLEAVAEQLGTVAILLMYQRSLVSVWPSKPR